MKADPGPKPELAWLDIDALFVDDRYQRTLESKRSVALIAKIAAEFYWPSFGVLTVAPAAAGGVENKFAIVDGQHRYTVAKHRGEAKVPCNIISAETLQEQAMAFLSANKDRIVVNQFAVYHAALRAGWPKAIAINGVCLEADVEIPKYQIPARFLKPHQTLAIKTIESAIGQHGTEIAVLALRTLREAFPTEPVLTARNIRGVADCFGTDHRVKIGPAVEALRKMGTDGIEGVLDKLRRTELLPYYQGVRRCLHDALFPVTTKPQAAPAAASKPASIKAPAVTNTNKRPYVSPFAMPVRERVVK